MANKPINPYTELTNLALAGLTKIVESNLGTPRPLLELDTIRQYLELLKFFELNRHKYQTEFIDGKVTVTEDNFYTLVELATGKKLDDYGFITGTCHPFVNAEGCMGMQSGSIVDGFIIWKKSPKKQKTFKVNSIVESFRETVKFLLEDAQTDSTN